MSARPTGTKKEIAAIVEALVSVARLTTQVRVHEDLCRKAGVDLDRGGAAVLFKLYTDGDHVRVTDLAERLGIDPPAVTRKVQQLERAGLVQRATDPHDARASLVILTRQGRRTFEHLLRAREEWLGALLCGWPERDVSEFARLLAQFAWTIEHRTEVSNGR